MAQMSVSDGGRFEFPYTITSALNNTNVGTLATANKFIDKDIDIKLTVASAAATVSASKAATAPTLAKTSTSVSGATNVGSSDATTTAPSGGYFVSAQATAPATTLDITKTVSTAGYLGANTQITASASTSATTGSVYYIPITTGVGAANTSSADITIESTDDSSKAGINISSALGTAVSSEPTSGYYLRIKADGSGSSKVTTAGWFPTGALTASSTSTTKFYPVTAAAGSVSGSNTVTPTVNLTTDSANNVSLSTTDNGIAVVATGGGTASAGAVAAITTAGYTPTNNSFATATIDASINTTSVTRYITGVNVPSSKEFGVTNSGGTVTVTSNSTSAGTITIAAKVAASDSAATTKNVVENGLWKNVMANGSGFYYGRVAVVNHSGSIGGSASSGSTTAAIAAVSYSGTGTSNLSYTTTAPSSGTAGQDYWQIKATATGTAGSYTPSYTVELGGWIGSTVTGTAQSVAVTSDTTGSSVYIAKAAISGSSTNAAATTTVAPGTVSIAKDTTSVTSKTRLNDTNDVYYKPQTATTNIDTYYIAVKASAAANTSGTTSSISGSGTASVTTAGYAPASLTGSISVSGTATAKTSAKDSSVYYIPIPTGTASSDFTNSGLSTYFNSGTSSDYNVSITPRHSISTAGYLPTVSNSNGTVSYYKIKTATPAFDGGTLSGGSTATGTNVTLSSTNNGIKIQTAYTAASTAVLYDGAVEGWVSKANDAQALAAQNLSSTNGTAYYVTAVTVPKDVNFSVTTTADTALDTSSDLDIINAPYRKVDILNSANGTVEIANSGTVTVAGVSSNGTTAISAKINNDDSSPTTENVMVNSKWKTNVVAAANTYYYGATKANAAEFSTSGGVTTCTSPGFVAQGDLSGGGTVSGGSIGTSSSDPGSSYIENTTAVVPSGGWLTLTAGYYSATKISLATLVPNGSNVAGHADYLLAGKTAYDNDGVLVTGSIQTYDGTYTYSST